MHVRKKIDSKKALASKNLTCQDLRKHYGTGQAFFIKYDKYGRKIDGYRNGIMTDVGDIEVSVWKSLVEDLIKKNGEQKLFEQLRSWLRDTIEWTIDAAELNQMALEHYAARLFDNSEWIDYLAFNQKYRPERLCNNDNFGDKPTID